VSWGKWDLNRTASTMTVTKSTMKETKMTVTRTVQVVHRSGPSDPPDTWLDPSGPSFYWTPWPRAEPQPVPRCGECGAEAVEGWPGFRLTHEDGCGWVAEMKQRLANRTLGYDRDSNILVDELRLPEDRMAG
jgi:hypothetical protein